MLSCLELLFGTGILLLASVEVVPFFRSRGLGPYGATELQAVLGSLDVVLVAALFIVAGVVLWTRFRWRWWLQPILALFVGYNVLEHLSYEHSLELDHAAEAKKPR